MQRVIPTDQMNREMVEKLWPTFSSFPRSQPWIQVGTVAPPGDLRRVIRVRTLGGYRFRRCPEKLLRRPARVAKPVASATEEHIPTALKRRNDDGR